MSGHDPSTPEFEASLANSQAPVHPQPGAGPSTARRRSMRRRHARSAAFSGHAEQRCLRRGAKRRSVPFAAREPQRARVSDHRRVVRAAREGRDEEADLPPRAHLGHPRAQPPVRRDAARQHDAREPLAVRRAHSLAHEDVHHSRLERRAKIRERLALRRRAERRDVPRHRALDPREAELERSPIRHPARQRDPRARRVPLRREPIHDRAARIPEPEQLPHLVERLPRGVVARRADLVDVRELGPVHAVNRRVPARHEQRDERVLRHGRLAPAPLQEDGEQVPHQMIDPDDRLLGRPSEPLRHLQPHEKRPREPGLRRHGDPVHVAQREPRLRERLRHDGRDGPRVIAGGDLRHHAPVRRVRGDLAAHDVGEHFPRGGDDGRRRLVARGLDAKHTHGRRTTSTLPMPAGPRRGTR